MKLTSFEAIEQALNRASVRFIVVDGLAVNAHGYLRFTNDIDLVIQFLERDILSSFHALEQIGYRPSKVLLVFARRSLLRSVHGRVGENLTFAVLGRIRAYKVNDSNLRLVLAF
jgi:hypothetical protein